MQSKAEIDQVLRQKCEAKEIPGVVAIAANSKEVIYQGAFGKRDLSKDDAMTMDSVFWIASMTKAITAAAAMQLVEQSKLSLDAPIGKVLPDLAGGGERQKARRLFARSSVHPARHDRHRLQDR